jgi:hypothetical protein
VYAFVHVVVAPGASDVTGHVIVPTFVSVTPTLVNVTLPEFVTMNAYAIVEPATEPVGAPACLSNVTAGVRVIVVDTELVAVTAAPVGGIPDAVAVLFTTPASTSPCVNEYDFVHVVDTPGASWVTGQLTGPTFGSLTPTDVTVTLPVFFTTNEYATVEPADIPDGAPAVFVNVTAGPDAIVVSVESDDVTAAPDGGVPVAVAVFATCPASTSACVSVYAFVHVVDAAGANCVTGHVTVPTFGSVTPTLVTVTLPEFVTMNVYAIVDPATNPLGTPACLSNVIAGVRVIGVLTELVAVIAEPVGGVPVAVAVLFTTPASTSACVSVYNFVHVVDAAGAREVNGHVTVPTFGSVTPTLVSVTLPVFFTRNEYRRVDPAVVPDGVPADLVSAIAGDRVIGVLVELVAVTAEPLGGVPEALAVLFTKPASTSAWVTV